MVDQDWLRAFDSTSIAHTNLLPLAPLITPLSKVVGLPDRYEYAMRIATQTESALICKDYSPHSLSLQFRCFWQHRERLLRWSGVKVTHRTRRRANRPPPCSLLATVKRDIGRPVACVMCLAISPAVCRLFLLASNFVSDEAHFWLNGYVNKQNYRIWIEANPQVHVETPLHPAKLTVWCALWAGGIIGPYFFKNDEGHNVTVNGDQYRGLITNFFIPELNNHDVQELWFQQDGATCHTARARIDLLKDTFGDRLISRFGPVNWPPRSCDLTRLDYFLWGYVKSLVYADKPQTHDHLEDNIRRVIFDILPQMLENVIENWTSRLDYIRASRGSHMPEIIFKM
ncbi:transposable element Tc3 transposase [Trichonephila clavipes]|nr:transposable element Tc3 transposase [Trichonephila clavipes]